MSILERLPFEGEPLGRLPPSAPNAPATPSPVKMHREGFWLGVAYDFFIVFICLFSLYLAAREEEHAAVFFIVVRAGLAVCELFRAPLAWMARVHGSAKWRSLCVSGVFALALVTAFNLFLPLNQGMRDSIASVQDARAALEAVEAIPAQLQKDVESKREIWNSALARVKDDNGAIGNQAAEHCWKQHCKNNSRGNELAAATAAVKKAEKDFHDAEAAQQKWNKGAGVEVLHKAHESYRKAASKNWVFGAVATLLRVDPETISPSGMSLALNGLTIPFCLMAGLLGSLILLGSVERIAPAKTIKPRSAERLEILKAGAAVMTREASGEVVKEFTQAVKTANAATKPAPANDNETKQPPSPLAEAMSEFLTKAKRTRGPAKKRRSRRPTARANSPSKKTRGM